MNNNCKSSNFTSKWFQNRPGFQRQRKFWKKVLTRQQKLENDLLQKTCIGFDKLWSYNWTTVKLGYNEQLRTGQICSL